MPTATSSKGPTAGAKLAIDKTTGPACGTQFTGDLPMAKKYGALAQKKVKKALHELKTGKLLSGKSSKKVTSKKQAIAIGLSEARAEGGKVPTQTAPQKKSAKKKSVKKKST